MTVGDVGAGEAALGIGVTHRRRDKRGTHRHWSAALEPLEGERLPGLRDGWQPEARPQQARVVRRIGIAVAGIERPR